VLGWPYVARGPDVAQACSRGKGSGTVSPDDTRGREGLSKCHVRFLTIFLHFWHDFWK